MISKIVCESEPNEISRTSRNKSHQAFCTYPNDTAGHLMRAPRAASVSGLFRFSMAAGEVSEPLIGASSAASHNLPTPPASSHRPLRWRLASIRPRRAVSTANSAPRGKAASIVNAFRSLRCGSEYDVQKEHRHCDGCKQIQNTEREISAHARSVA